MKLHLAPMEGLIDSTVRELLTALGGFDLCVSEFLRASNNLAPPRTFYRVCPELLSGGRTSSGVPVHLQILG